MQLLVVGATGGTGRQVVEQALDQGHFVTALVRDPARLPVQHPNLTVVIGDVLKPETILPAVRRQDAVICSLGGRPGQSDQAVAEGTKNLIAAMHQAGIKRLFVVSSLGVGTSYEEAPLPSKLFIKTFLSGPIAEKEKQEKAVRESDLDWLIVRPTRLTDGPVTKHYRLGEHLPFPLFSMPRISRADVAAFLLDQLESNANLHKAVTITGR
ncbi:NAD(P)-dependent oxidoreductase [Spirosoma fluviale]|uniref:NADH-flavin reductase n=1 Tax=Spirosoma fluviale TaxID=1597977 RepID=A0A286FAQ1_9BACT|nr:NAD(P)-binding oxidoreductase [Spirosoma fluviale]SOD80317.1 Putative NADH-flavin reductase [Spirosoma fluviale]